MEFTFIKVASSDEQWQSRNPNGLNGSHTRMKVMAEIVTKR
jgi:hypothetical protein